MNRLRDVSTAYSFGIVFECDGSAAAAVLADGVDDLLAVLAVLDGDGAVVAAFTAGAEVGSVLGPVVLAIAEEVEVVGPLMPAGAVVGSVLGAVDLASIAAVVGEVLGNVTGICATAIALAVSIKQKEEIATRFTASRSFRH